MAGKRGRTPMAERVARSGRQPSGPQRVAADAPDCPARHCWVGDPADGGAEKRPGLLVEWRRAGGGWEGRVVYVAQLRAGQWALVEEWVAESQLSPC
jgi:hypothetical protein